MDKEIPIEDFFEDIVGKAMRGLRVSSASLSSKIGISEDAIQRVLDGHFQEETLRAIAPALGLHDESLLTAGGKTWRPAAVEVPGLAMFNTVWHDMQVNAFVIYDAAARVAAIFDTGADCSPILDFLKEKNLTVCGIFLTHTHPDHIADLDRLLKETGHPAVFVNSLEKAMVDVATVAIDEGSTSAVGELKLRTLQTSGHAVGGNTYVIEGLERPLAIVGDSLFAGSMGGGSISYEEALKNNREKILALPDITVVCPGHGPMTSVGEEKAHNPFFPEFK